MPCFAYSIFSPYLRCFLKKHFNFILKSLACYLKFYQLYGGTNDYPKNNNSFSIFSFSFVWMSIRKAAIKSICNESHNRKSVVWSAEKSQQNIFFPTNPTQYTIFVFQFQFCFPFHLHL